MLPRWASNPLAIVPPVTLISVPNRASMSLPIAPSWSITWGADGLKILADLPTGKGQRTTPPGGEIRAHDLSRVQCEFFSRQRCLAAG